MLQANLTLSLAAGSQLLPAPASAQWIQGLLLFSMAFSTQVMGSWNSVAKGLKIASCSCFSGFEFQGGLVLSVFEEIFFVSFLEH